MDRGDCVHGLEFNDNQVFEEEIHAISEVKLDAAVHDRKADFSPGRGTQAAKFVL